MQVIRLHIMLDRNLAPWTRTVNTGAPIE